MTWRFFRIKLVCLGGPRHTDERGQAYLGWSVTREGDRTSRQRLQVLQQEGSGSMQSYSLPLLAPASVAGLGSGRWSSFALSMRLVMGWPQTPLHSTPPLARAALCRPKISGDLHQFLCQRRIFQKHPAQKGPSWAGIKRSGWFTL